MEINRNQYFMLGIVILLLGIQLRMVETYVLNEKSARFISLQMQKIPKKKKRVSTKRVLQAASPLSMQPIHPPNWLGWALISVGSVLILHSLAMKNPSS